MLRLALVQGVGPQRLAALIEAFGSAERALDAPVRAVGALPGFGSSLVGRIKAARDPAQGSAARAAIATLRSVGAFVITRQSALYPPAFTHLPDAPYLLFAAGDPELLKLPGIAVVGTREPTPYGRAVAEELSAELGVAGFSIISGLARGIDSAAHLGALRSGCSTVAVLGNGIEQVYPWESRRLRDQIREKGLILTEYPPGETPKPGNFPRRNRLITALSEAVLVVEMGIHSGAQHTVGYALEQGKEVLAIPGSINSPASAGTNQLIKEGARLVTSAADVIEELRGVGRSSVRPSSPSTAGPAELRSSALQLLSPGEQKLMRSLSPDPAHVDEIARDAGETTAAILTTLLHLEMRGLVSALPGKRYCLT